MEQVYACWFMTLPNMLTNLNTTQSTSAAINLVVELSLQKIRKMQSLMCNLNNEVISKTNKIFTRVLFNFCHENKMSRLSQKLMVFFKDIGIPIDPTNFCDHGDSKAPFNNIIHKRTTDFKNFNINELAKDLIQEIYQSKTQDFRIFDKKDYLINTFDQLTMKIDIYYEIHMNTRHECVSCGRFLYDEQILAEFSVSESTTLTR
ncbi:hypothetical protein RF11_15538 [Thelohanellus kitauei]|uniref:Uncharacterized protein n=1 Tax=Thelohanellus kitauei TaxID=669202 RepID=A0A0C2JW29_THEKT|nr:hypothetical protein RF11_15538 [Thelohanellus kitauei]